MLSLRAKLVAQAAEKKAKREAELQQQKIAEGEGKEIDAEKDEVRIFFSFPAPPFPSLPLPFLPLTSPPFPFPGPFSLLSSSIHCIISMRRV